MRFCPNEPPDHYRGSDSPGTTSERSSDGDEGIAYYRYPVFSGSGSRRREPDFLVLSRKFGIWVFECKGARLDNIHEINGQEWVMQRWYASA
ncbi:MAG: nuclease-related domain-containing protein [Gammaproteobacteria bacterium]|nr:nuclease-related domain-containing protein [Gammaproteobacteria bacterium]